MGYQFPALIGCAVMLAGAMFFYLFTQRTKPVGPVIWNYFFYNLVI